MNYKLIERDAFQIVGINKLFDCNEEFNQSIAIGHFWAELGQSGFINRLLRLNNGEISGPIGATVDYNKETNQIEYWVGTEFSGETPDDLSCYEIPSAKWVVFGALGPVGEAVPETLNKIYAEWFPSNDYEHSGAPTLEVYKSPDPTSPTAKTEIWIPVKS